MNQLHNASYNSTTSRATRRQSSAHYSKTLHMGLLCICVHERVQHIQHSTLRMQWKDLTGLIMETMLAIKHRHHFSHQCIMRFPLLRVPEAGQSNWQASVSPWRLPSRRAGLWGWLAWLAFWHGHGHHLHLLRQLGHRLYCLLLPLLFLFPIFLKPNRYFIFYIFYFYLYSHLNDQQNHQYI